MSHDCVMYSAGRVLSAVPYEASAPAGEATQSTPQQTGVQFPSACGAPVTSGAGTDDQETSLGAHFCAHGRASPEASCVRGLPSYSFPHPQN